MNRTVTAVQMGLLNCHVCSQLSRPAQGARGMGCSRCGAALHFRKPASVSRCWELLIAAMILYVPANLLPMMKTSSLFGTQSDTIMSGVVYFWTSGSWYLALIIFFASIMVPLLKMIALVLLLVSVQARSRWQPVQRARLYRLVEFVGSHEIGAKGVDELRQVLQFAKRSGTNQRIKLDPTLARGLSYYTGAIIEINVADLAGSLGGGGRYDNLVGMFLGKDVPACGFSLGLERIIVVMSEREMFPTQLLSSPADVMVRATSEPLPISV